MFERPLKSWRTRATVKLLPKPAAAIIGLHVEQSDVGWPRPAGESRAGEDRNLLSVLADADAPAEEHFGLAGAADREEPGILQEERPLLREEEIEAVQIHLLLVHFDLGEVGVDGRVQRQARRHAVLGVEADVPEELRVAARRATLPGFAERVRDRVRGFAGPED